jgi:hypothetical protein
MTESNSPRAALISGAGGDGRAEAGDGFATESTLRLSTNRIRRSSLGGAARRIAGAPRKV